MQVEKMASIGLLTASNSVLKAARMASLCSSLNAAMSLVLSPCASGNPHCLCIDADLLAKTTSIGGQGMRTCWCMRTLTGSLAPRRDANQLEQVKQGLRRAVGKRRRPDGCADRCVRHPSR